MPSYVVKLDENEYISFSTVVEAPVSRIVTREVAAEEWGEDRVQRADATGTSLRIPMLNVQPGQTWDDWLAGESLNQPEPWAVKKIRDEIGYAPAGEFESA